MYHFAAILRLLEASQATADHRRCLPENRSSVASQLATMECFHFLLRCSSQLKVFENIQLGNLSHISQESLSNFHHNKENRMQIA